MTDGPGPGEYRIDAATAFSPRYWLTWIGLGTWRTVCQLPLPVVSVIGRSIGELLYWILASRRAVALRNVEACFPELDEAARNVLVRRHYRAVGQSIFDTGVAAWASERRLERLVDVSGREHLERAASAGRSVILLAPHFVSLGVGGLYWSHVERVFAMYKQSKNELFHMAYRRVCTGQLTGVRLLDWLTGNGHRRHFLDLVEHRAGLKPAARRLRAGEHFYYLPDQDLGRRQAVFAPFFGIQANTISAGSRFAKLGNAVVIPVVVLQKPGGRGYQLRFCPPLGGYPGDDPVSDATLVNARIEALVREHPEQYFWLHKRFKTRPDGEPPFYG